MSLTEPSLPDDGLVAVVKRDCPTCELTAPVLAQLAAAGRLQVYTQDDPAFPAAFPWFNTPHYWQDRILELREQVALMQEPPLQV